MQVSASDFETAAPCATFPWWRGKFLEVSVNRGTIRALTLPAIFALAACSGSSVSGSLVPASTSSGPDGGGVPFQGFDPVRRLCTTPATADQLQCFGMVRTDVQPVPSTASSVQAQVEKCPFEGRAYCPIDLQAAYKLPSLTKGNGRLVAIVDAYGYRHAAGDLATYRKTMGLKPCITATKCLRIVNQNGQASPLPPEPPPSDDWKGEESLDLDMVSAICPNCKIVLVQTNNNLTTNLYAGVKTAGRLGAKYIGASWGGPESGGDNPIFHQQGVVISAAAGDNGGGGRYHGGPQQPCSYTYVVCVGGTNLKKAQNTRGWSESVWNDWNFDYCGSGSPCGATGSGCSKKIAKPGWQTDTGCHMRSEADVSATASLRNPVAVYNSEESLTYVWFAFGGTSASAQIISGVFALAGNAATQNGPAGIWKHQAHNLNDVSVGNNISVRLGVVCASRVKYICTARFGFDGPTGWGTPKGIGAF